MTTPIEISIWIASKTRWAHLTKTVTLPCVPRVGEYVQFDNEIEGRGFSWCVTRVTYREAGGVSVWTELLDDIEGRGYSFESEECFEARVQSYEAAGFSCPRGITKNHRVALAKGTGAIHVALARAIQSGEFGPLRIGMDKREVRALLGAPAVRMEAPDGKRARGWKYGDIEIYFNLEDDTIEQVFLDDFTEIAGGVIMTIDAEGIRGGMAFDDVVGWLEKNVITYEEIPAPTAETRLLKTTSGVTLTIVTKPEAPGERAGLFSLTWSGATETWV